MSLTWALISFVIIIIFILVTIIKFKIHPFIALISGALIMGLINRLPFTEITKAVSQGFGGTLANIGIVIAFGVILGHILYKSGCAQEIANLLLKVVGADKSILAINITGIVVSIPVFFDAAFVIIVNLIKSISSKGKIPFISLVTSLSVGLIVTHCLVIPTPGPLAVAANTGVDLGYFFIYSILVAIPAAITGGVVYGKMIGKAIPYNTDFGNAFSEETEELDIKSAKRPNGVLGISLILLPIFLILIGTVLANMFEKGSTAYNLLHFIGDKNIALMTGTIVAYLSLSKYLKETFEELITQAAYQTGVIFLITGAGGSFGTIINYTSIGNSLKISLAGLASGSNITVLLVISAFIISQILRSAQGSSTVALVTTSSIMSPVLADLTGISTVLIAIATCAGGVGGSLPNDSGFWVVNRFSRFNTIDTIKSWTIGGSIAGFTALIITIILCFVSDFLPGLH